MPRLSLYRNTRTKDYQFFDRNIREQYMVGGIDIYVHRYLGPQTGGTNGVDSGNFDATQPVYEEQSILNIQDLLLLENRDRVYDPNIYIMRMVYRSQDVDFDLSQFGLFLNNDTLFLTTHYNSMIDVIGRKLMNGDVIEVPNLKDYHPLNQALPRALPRYYVVQDANYASEGFSQTWQPHLWRIKATPLTNQQEFANILNKPMVEENIWDNGNFYPTNTIVNQGDVYYRAVQNVLAGIDIADTDYWTPYTPPTIGDLQSTRNKDIAINDAILTQANADVPLSGFDVEKFYIVPTTESGEPANPTSLSTTGGTTVDGTQGGMNVTPRSNGYTVGYLTGDGIAPNGLPVTPGVSFPSNPVLGDYALRLDYMPNRLFRFSGNMWIRIEDKVRTELNNGPTNQTLRSSFVNNTFLTPTTDQGNIPQRQSLSQALKPMADNGNQGGNWLKVTLQFAADTVTSAEHGLVVGIQLSFSVITSTTGISINTWYYATVITANTFKLATTVQNAIAGISIDLLTANGTGTLRYTTPPG